jgi:ribonuclease Z
MLASPSLRSDQQRWRRRVKNGRARPVIDTSEVHSGVIFDQDGVVVRAFEVDHGEISPAFGYRIDAAGR